MKDATLIMILLKVIYLQCNGVRNTYRKLSALFKIINSMLLGPTII